jgi:hypothetical protein
MWSTVINVSHYFVLLYDQGRLWIVSLPTNLPVDSRLSEAQDLFARAGEELRHLLQMFCFLLLIILSTPSLHTLRILNGFESDLIGRCRSS